MKKTLPILSLLLVFACAQAQNPGAWQQMSSIGASLPPVSAACFSIGGKGYIGTGNYGTAFWEYDQASDSWSQKANFEGLGRDGAIGFSIGSKGYISCGGIVDYPFMAKDLWEYNPETNAWKRRADCPGVQRQDGTGFSIGNKGYIGTGIYYYGYIDGQDVLISCSDFWEYDPATDSWTQKVDFGGTARYGAVGFSVGSKGYIGTGGAKDFWEYDPETDVWTRKADFGGTARSYAVGFSIGSKGYIGTGGAKDFWEYDPETDVWTRKADFGGTERSFATGLNIGRYGYIGFGDKYTYDWWQYTPADVLPLQLTSFTAEHTGKTNVLHWLTSQEVNSSHFDIEKSNDGAAFTKIGTVKATGSSLQNSYSYTDINLSKPLYYYRLKIIDKDASFTYSKIIKVGNNSGFDVTITPNPVTSGLLNLAVYTENTNPISITITGMDGKTAYTQQFTPASGYVGKTINVTAFAKGAYVLKAVNGKENKVIKFVKE